MSVRTIFVILSIAAGVVVLASCDSTDSEGCAVVGDELRSRSVALLGGGNTPVAQFEMQQEIKQYESGCSTPDVDEVTLVIRNETNCVQDVTYTLSVFAGQVGWSVNGTTSLTPAGATNEGTVQVDGGVNIETGQTLVTGQATQGACS